ncbi:MAG: substrate-binding domain-containing protein [Ignavibacteria bacterium]|nr:substrate-binding domain-containing protein [Ignavibacteria bacterium]
MKKNSLLIMVVLLAFAACDNEPKQNNGMPAETVRAGNVEIACDESVYALLKAIQPVYDTAFPDAKITLKPMPARAAMSELFALKARGIIVARDYTRDEDSVLKAYKRSPHGKFLLAKDALVFFVKRNFPLDTISKNQLAEIFGNTKQTFKQYFPHLPAEPSIVLPSEQSSEYANIVQLVMNNKLTTRTTLHVTSPDSVLFMVKNTFSIGVSYLSRIVKDTSLKPLMIGYDDSTGEHIWPKPVHQSYIVMEKYPFIVPIFGYLQEERQNLPWGFLTFIRTDPRIQQYFLNAGIVPGFGKFNLIPLED